jgi:hypothetical protein
VAEDADVVELIDAVTEKEKKVAKQIEYHADSGSIS